MEQINEFSIAYTRALVDKIKAQLREEISNEKLTILVQKNLIDAHVIDKKSSNFQRYYFEILKNEEKLKEPQYFKSFLSHYSLQGINAEFREEIECQKHEILKLIKAEDLVQLYFSYFRSAILERKGATYKSEQGSFFTKLVHTFLPHKFVALDGPIKKYTGLEKESFFQSFIALSQAYIEFAQENKDLLLSIRKAFKKLDTGSNMQHDKITDLKLLDLILWSKANPIIECIPKGDKTKRFLLGIAGAKNLLWIGLNPSTASEKGHDNTSRNVEKITFANGYDGWLLANLYPARTPKPKDLPATKDAALFNENLQQVEKLLQQEGYVQGVCLAWGNNIKEANRDYLSEACAKFATLFIQYGIKVYCISTTNKNHPLHPSQQSLNAKDIKATDVQLQPFDFSSYLTVLN